MVLKGKIYSALKYYLDEYLYGFEKNQMEVALLSGHIDLVNVNFRPDKVNSLMETKNLPFRLKAGLIGKLSFKFHYMNFLSSPLELTVDELYLVLGPLISKDAQSDSDSSSDWEMSVSSEESVEMPSSYSFLKTQDFSESDDLEEGFFKKYFRTIAKNLTVVVNKVHVRYEDDIYNYFNPYSFGVLFDHLEMHSFATEWHFNENKEPKQRPTPKNSSSKNIKVEGFSAYISSMTGMLIPTSLTESTENSPIGIFEALAASEVRQILLEEAKEQQSNYFIAPTTIYVCFTIEDQFYRGSLSFKSLDVSFSSSMKECLTQFLEYYNNVKVWNITKEFRPPARISHCSNKTQVVKQWFQYAFKCIKKKNQIITQNREAKRKHKRRTEKLKFSKSRQCTEINNPPKLRHFTSPHKSPSLVSSVSKKPYCGEEFYPEFLVNSHLSFKVLRASLRLFDEETNIQCVWGAEYLWNDININQDELWGSSEIGKMTCGMQDENGFYEMATLGKTKTKHVRHTKEGIIQPSETACLVTYHHRPCEYKALQEGFPNFNMYDLDVQLSPITFVYKQVFLSHALVLLEAFQLDKAHRENTDANYVKKLERKRSNLTPKESFVLKERKVKHSAALKRFILTKKLASKLVKFQKKLRSSLKRADKKIQNIGFKWSLGFRGLECEFQDFTGHALSRVFLPNGKLFIEKKQTELELNLWNIGAKTSHRLEDLYNYFSEISELIARKVDDLSAISKYQAFS